MIHIYVKASYDPTMKRGFYYLFLYTGGRLVQRYRETGRHECQSAFEAECEAIYRGLDWVCKNRLAIEPVEVYCSKYISLCLGPQTAKYFRPMNEAAASAIGTILQVIKGLASLKVTFLERPAEDNSFVEMGLEKPEVEVRH